MFEGQLSRTLASLEDLFLIAGFDWSHMTFVGAPASLAIGHVSLPTEQSNRLRDLSMGSAEHT